MWPLDLWGVCLDAKTPEKSPCDRSRTASSPSLRARQPGDHKGRAALDSEDTAQTSLGPADRPAALGQTEGAMLPPWRETAGGRARLL